MISIAISIITTIFITSTVIAIPIIATITIIAEVMVPHTEELLKKYLLSE